MALALVNAWSTGDAYALVADPPYDGKHLLIEVRQDLHVPRSGSPAGKLVSYDPADVLGTSRVPGHPGVLELRLSTPPTFESAIDNPDDPSVYGTFLTGFDAADYVATEV